MRRGLRIEERCGKKEYMSKGGSEGKETGGEDNMERRGEKKFMKRP